ncbi:MAG: SDR family oxidoreductase, partial [Bacteroidia bacterium]|nr:SDR family oxidoreductase [Bacteroidia bacterium]
KIRAVSRNTLALQKLKDECAKAGNTIGIISIDLANENLSEKLVPAIQDQFSYVDVLINNAGTLVNKPFEQISDRDLEQIYNVNVLSLFKLTRDLIPLLTQSKLRAHVVNISSMGGILGSVKFPGLTAYSSSKGAVAILTECLAEEFKQSNLSFNCLALGAAQTEMLEEAFPGYKAPLTALQMAAYIADFALNGHKYFNGKVLPVSLSTP